MEACRMLSLVLCLSMMGCSAFNVNRPQNSWLNGYLGQRMQQQRMGQPQNNWYDGDRMGQQQNNWYDGDRMGQQQNNWYDGDRMGQQQNNWYDGDRIGQQQNNRYNGDRMGQKQNNWYNENRMGLQQNNRYDGDQMKYRPNNWYDNKQTGQLQNNWYGNEQMGQKQNNWFDDDRMWEDDFWSDDEDSLSDDIVGSTRMMSDDFWSDDGFDDDIMEYDAFDGEHMGRSYWSAEDDSFITFSAQDDFPGSTRMMSNDYWSDEDDSFITFSASDDFPGSTRMMSNDYWSDEDDSFITFSNPDDFPGGPRMRSGNYRGDRMEQRQRYGFDDDRNRYNLFDGKHMGGSSKWSDDYWSDEDNTWSDNTWSDNTWSDDMSYDSPEFNIKGRSMAAISQQPDEIDCSEVEESYAWYKLQTEKEAIHEAIDYYLDMGQRHFGTSNTEIEEQYNQNMAQDDYETLKAILDSSYDWVVEMGGCGIQIAGRSMSRGDSDSSVEDNTWSDNTWSYDYMSDDSPAYDFNIKGRSMAAISQQPDEIDCSEVEESYAWYKLQTEKEAISEAIDYYLDMGQRHFGTSNTEIEERYNQNMGQDDMETLKAILDSSYNWVVEMGGCGIQIAGRSMSRGDSDSSDSWSYESSEEREPTTEAPAIDGRAIYRRSTDEPNFVDEGVGADGSVTPFM